MKELDFSEIACIERYSKSSYLDEDSKDRVCIERLTCDDSIIRALNTNGYISLDWAIYETKNYLEDNDVYSLQIGV